jgi:hypothetical protein
MAVCSPVTGRRSATVACSPAGRTAVATVPRLPLPLPIAVRAVMPVLPTAVRAARRLPAVVTPAVLRPKAAAPVASAAVPA